MLAAERELEDAARALARGELAEERYSRALERFLALGGGDFDARARTVCADLGLDVDLERARDGLSGGEAARVALASILLSRFDVLLLDEPTNDLDFDGLERLERFLGVVRRRARARLARPRAARPHGRPDRCDRSAIATASASGRAAGATTSARARPSARRRWPSSSRRSSRRRQLTELLSTRRTEARAKGAALGNKTGGADRRATHALETKVRQAERLLERNELPEKPFEPWELQSHPRRRARGSPTTC